MNKEYETELTSEQLKYLQLLSQKFPTTQAASTEIINLEAIINLPKGTEHFLTDIHGEYETFNHVLRNASGVVRRKIDQIFGKKISEQERQLLASLIYYPQEKLEALNKKNTLTNEWYNLMLRRLMEVARVAAKKYTQSKLRKAMPPDFAYIIDELLNEANDKKGNYVDNIVQSIIEIGRAWHFVVAICGFIQRLLIDRLHIIGDIFDRGPNAAKVMETIINHHSFDIQWGNHDIIWIGAACGIDGHIAEVIRFSARYENLDTLEDAYGINLMPLVTFAFTQYRDDLCECFMPKSSGAESSHDMSKQMTTLMHKAISVIGWKLEGQIIKRNPKFQMEHRLLLDKIDYEKGTISINKKTYELKDKHFPTIDPKDPYALTKGEKEVIEKLRFSFLNCEKLQAHVNVLIGKGSMYLAYNGNLLFHGCIPMKDGKTFEQFDFNGEILQGKDLCKTFDKIVRRARVNRNNPDALQQDFDWCWYLWCGPCSPLFGKKKMATFERYLIDDKDLHKEDRNAYFKFRDQEETCNLILNEFGLSPKTSHIINGHTPVKDGENPIKADGKLYVIDGGLSKAYRKETGKSGYTLIYNSNSLILVKHDHKQNVEDKEHIISERCHVATLSDKTICVGDTDIGVELKQQVADLKLLLKAYKDALINEK